jgi:AraC family transcriptional regulator
MTELKPPRLTTGRPMLLAGIRQHHAFSSSAETIPRQWEAFHHLAPMPGAITPTAYGVICGSNLPEQSFEYMCAFEMPDFAPVPADLGRVRILTQEYAVFTYVGPMAGIQTTWNSIWNEWLPASGYVTANVPDFEVYDERYDRQTGLGSVELWLGITD